MGSLLDEVGVQKARSRYNCPNCRADVAKDATLCVNCGTDLESGEQVKQKLYASAGGKTKKQLAAEKSTKFDNPRVKYGASAALVISVLLAILKLASRFLGE